MVVRKQRKSGGREIPHQNPFEKAGANWKIISEKNLKVYYTEN
jgi:hypothetical protein